MANLIYVTIKNNTKAAVVLGWTKRRTWIDPGCTVSVDYDPWSACEQYQRKTIEGYIKSGDLELTMHIYGADGKVHDIVYGVPVVNVEQPVGSSVKPVADIVVSPAGMSTGASAEAGRYGFKTVEVVADGFDKAAVDKESASFTVSTSEVLNKDSVSGVADTVADIKDVFDDTAERFNALCAEHKWADALKVLVDKFGDDRISFTSRALMTLKTYDAVCEKYGLA